MNRSMTVLLLVALVLAGLVLLVANPFQDRLRRDPSARVSLFDAEEVLDADRLEMVADGDTTVLARAEGDWVVGDDGFPADTAAVGTILRGIAGARSLGVASRNPDNRGRFQVGEGGVSVAVGKGGTLARFVLGKPGRDFTTSYLRRAEEDEVHIVRGLNRNLFTRPQGFRDRTLLAFEPDAVARVTLYGTEPGWVLARGDTAWTVALPGVEPGPADEAKVTPVLRALSTLAADGFADGEWRGTERTVEVVLRNGTTLRLELGAPGEDKRIPVRRPDRDAVYQLSEWRVDSFARPAGDFAPGS